MIGIFDSGSGGLTVLEALRRTLPEADILYFGDIKNAPYGSRPPEELSALTLSALQTLHRRGADRIVSACNSVSASLALSLLDAFDIEPSRIIEMVGPTVSAFKETDARILLVATPATTRSGIYENAFRMLGKHVTSLPIPDLAGAIEFGQPETVLRDILTRAFEHLDPSSFDILILACTHYPLILPLFREALPEIEIFDPAEAVATRAKRLFWPQEVRNGKLHFLLSQDSPQFRSLVQKKFGNEKYAIEVLQ